MKRLNWNGFIGEGEPINANMVTDELRIAAGEDVEIYLHSKGGDVFEARNIYQQLVEYKGNVTFILGGIVASAGTYLSLAGNEIIANDDTAYMIHNAWAVVIGDYRDMVKAADNLRRENKLIASKLADRSGKDVEDIITMMNDETWLYGQEIVDAGFADKLNGDGSAQEGVKEAAIENARLQIAACLREVSSMSHQFTFKNKETGKPKEKEEHMDKTSAVDFLKKEMNSVEIANAFGITVVTKDSLELLNKLKEKGIEDPIAKIEELQNSIKQNDETIRAAKMTTAYGKTGTDEKPNLERNYAERVLANTPVNKLGEEIEKLKDDSVMKTFAKQRADESSNFNLVEKSGNTEPEIIDC